MAKKIWYSTPLKFFWDELYAKQKKITPELSDEQIYHILQFNLLKSKISPGENASSRDSLLSGLDLWKEDSIGDFLHVFFLDKYLQNFLEQTPLSDLESIKKYLYENGKEKIIKYFKTTSQNNCVMYSFGLHIPYEKDGYAFLLTLYENNAMELYFYHGKQSGGLSDNFYVDLNKKKDEKSIEIAKMFRLAINTIAYMKCFPECVSEGVPKVSYDTNEGRSDRNLTFQLTDKITDIDKTQRTKIPHFRKGFFKVLRSDYFVNKKDQIIYVTETMVKGKAKTVTTSTQLDKFETNNEKQSS